jgi:DNA-binding IclR family transcriptional regulator
LIISDAWPAGKRTEADVAKTQRGIQSIEVGGALLKALAADAHALTLGELARRAGMSAAKAHPYAVSFGKLGLFEQDPLSGRYALGPFALELGLASLKRLDPVRIALAEASALADALGQTVALSVAGSHGPTVVSLTESSRPIHVNMRAGTVLSLTNTATGRVFAAWLPRIEVKRLLAREAGDRAILTAPTARRPAAQDVERLADEVRRHGLARTVDRPIPGVSALAAPVFDASGKLALAMTVTGPSGTLDTAWRGEAARALVAAARRVSSRLGAPPG